MTIKGYSVGAGWNGYLESEGDYQLFETDGAYTEYVRESEEESD